MGALKTGNVIVNTFKGVVVDGYITGGTVFADANRNSVLDEGKSSSTTDSSGNFEILGGSGPYILIGGTDISTGLAFKGIFEAPPRAKVINPLTTLLSGVAGLNATDAEIATAQTLVKSVLKLDSGIDLLSYDPIIEATTSGRSAAEIAIAVSAQGEAAKIANLMVQGTSVLAGAATSTINTGDAGRAILRPCPTPSRRCRPAPRSIWPRLPRSRRFSATPPAACPASTRPAWAPSPPTRRG